MIPPASASAATRMPADRSRAYRYDANAASAVRKEMEEAQRPHFGDVAQEYSPAGGGRVERREVRRREYVAEPQPTREKHNSRCPVAAHTASTRADIASSLMSSLTDPIPARATVAAASRGPTLPLAAEGADTATNGMAPHAIGAKEHDVGADPRHDRILNRTNSATSANCQPAHREITQRTDTWPTGRTQGVSPPAATRHRRETRLPLRRWGSRWCEVTACALRLPVGLISGAL